MHSSRRHSNTNHKSFGLIFCTLVRNRLSTGRKWPKHPCCCVSSGVTYISNVLIKLWWVQWLLGKKESLVDNKCWSTWHAPARWMSGQADTKFALQLLPASPVTASTPHRKPGSKLAHTIKKKQSDFTSDVFVSSKYTCNTIISLVCTLKPWWIAHANSVLLIFYFVVCFFNLLHPIAISLSDG